MTDVYKQEETHEETIAQRDARLKKANETARHEEILGLLSQLNPTTGEVALCGDVAGHEFHGNQHTGGGGDGGGDGGGKTSAASPEKRGGTKAGRAAEDAKTGYDHRKAFDYHNKEAEKLHARGDHAAAEKHEYAARAHEVAWNEHAGKLPAKVDKNISEKARGASSAAHQYKQEYAQGANHEPKTSSEGAGKRTTGGDGSDGSRRAQAEGASTSTQHSSARDHHIAKADEAYKAGHDHLGAAHDRAAIEHHKAEKMGSETEQSSVARRASAKAHDLEDKIRSGK